MRLSYQVLSCIILAYLQLLWASIISNFNHLPLGYPNENELLPHPATLPQLYFDRFDICARLIDIAYCISPADRIEFPFQCHNECSRFPNMTLIAQFTGDNSLQTLSITGYISIDHSRKTIYISLRGTRSFGDALTDIDSQQISINHICFNCRIHKGFFETFDNTLSKIDPYLVELVENYPDYQILILGHSLGGAIANLVSYHIWDKLHFINFKCITMGAPVLGNTALSQYFSNIFKLHAPLLQDRLLYRITNKGDTVPTLPITSTQYDYRQLPGEIFISNLDLDTLSTRDVMICRGGEDFNCIKNFYGINFDSHVVYFKKLGYCGYGFS